MGQGLQLSWFRCMLAFKLPHLLSDPSAAIKGCSPKCSGTDGRVGWVHPDRLHLCATCLASCSSKARDLRSKGRQGHAFTDKGGARANQNSHEQGSSARTSHQTLGQRARERGPTRQPLTTTLGRPSQVVCICSQGHRYVVLS
jgi:hypothetical protein